MSNEKRIIAYVRNALNVALKSDDMNDVAHLDFELNMLDKFLDALPDYEAKTAIDVICGKEEK